MSYSVCVSSSTFFSVLATFQVKECLCFIFQVFQFSRYSPAETVFVLFFHIFLFCCHNPGPICVFHIFHVFHCFLLYSRSYPVYISFFSFVSFLMIIQVLQCAFHIIHVFHCFSPYSRSYSVSFSFCTFFSFLAIIQIKQFCVSFSTLFSSSHNIPGHTVFVFHFPRFSVFLPHSR